MSADAQHAALFYTTAQGSLAARLIGERIAAIWPSAAGQSILGIGHAGPYLPPSAGPGEARSCIALTQAQAGVTRWPTGARSLSCTAEEDALPFPDLCFDRLLLVHGLEAADNARRLLREAWRVLKDDGRLLVVTPNRRGWWAHVDSTPFGQGQPYSPGQIARLLQASLFRVERRDTALYVPPTRFGPILRTAPIWERSGRLLAPRFAGVTLTEAVKDLYAAVPIKAFARRRRVIHQAG